MSAEPPSPTRRRYRSPHREQQAAQTRAAVLTAASGLFARDGWAATGVRDVAAAAGVSVETVYAIFGSKTALLLAAVDAGVVGDLDDVALAERAEFRALASGSRAERIAALVRLGTAIHERVAGLLLALREAAASDPDAAARWRELEERRRNDLGDALELVAGQPVAGDVRDGLWAIASTEVFHLLTGHAGWTHPQYRAWSADVIDRLLPGKADD